MQYCTTNYMLQVNTLSIAYAQILQPFTTFLTSINLQQIVMGVISQFFEQYH